MIQDQRIGERSGLRIALLAGTAAVLCMPALAKAEEAETEASVALEQSSPQQSSSNEGAPAANQPTSAELPEGAIVVIGIRQSLETALETRRNAEVILDGISADDIGSTPDLNLGEALQRIPGVQINREAGRRDATISVRGLPGRFTKTTVMGQTIASPTRGENVGNPFGIFESGIFNGANVIKSFTPDTPSGGLAAQVDLRINDALHRREGFVVRAEMGYEETTQDFNPSYFASAAHRFGDRLGVYGTLAYSDQSFRRDTFRVNSYARYSQAQVDGFAAGTRANGLGDAVSLTANPAFSIAATDAEGVDNAVIYPREIRQFVQTNAGYRVSGAAGLAYELSDDLLFRVDGLYTRRDLTDSNQDLFLLQSNPAQSIISPLSNPIMVGLADFDDNGTDENVYLVSRVQVSDYLTAIGNRSFPQLDEVWAVYPQVNFENDDWRLDVVGTYSEALGTTQLNQYDIRVAQRGGAADSNGDGIDDAGNGSLGIFDTGAGDLGSIFISHSVPSALTDLSAINAAGRAWTIQASTIGGQVTVPITAPNGSTQNVTVSSLVAGFTDEVRRDITAIDVDLARKFENSFVTEVAVGGYYSRENAERVRQDNAAIGLNFPALTNAIYKPNDGISRGGQYVGGQIPGALADTFLSIDIPVIESQLGAPGRELPPGVSWNPNAAQKRSLFPELTDASAASISVDEILAALPENSGTGYLQRLPQRNQIDRNYRSERETLELYGMVRFDLGRTSDFNLRGNVGGRFIRTDLGGQLTPTSAEFYDNLAAIRAASGGPALEFRDGDLVNPAREENTFERFLPSANLLYEITPDLVVRAAYYHTFEAFDLAEFSPSQTLIKEVAPGGDPDDTGFLEPSIYVNVSGLDIKPRRSEAFDIGLSWYNRPGGVISVGFFRKSLINDITRFNDYCPEGEAFAVNGQVFSDLRVNAGRCYFTNSDGDPQRIRINVSLNNPDTINVTGFEGQIQQRLDFLPGFLRNTGFVANYTRVRSSGDNDTQLFNVAEDTYNLVGYYDDSFLQLRLAYNNQSEIQLEGGSSFTGGSSRVAPRSQLDFSGAIRPMRGLEVRFEVFNITNTSRREYITYDELLRVYDYDGRTYGTSVSYRF